jgi:hypothetical protein
MEEGRTVSDSLATIQYRFNFNMNGNITAISVT